MALQPPLHTSPVVWRARIARILLLVLSSVLGFTSDRSFADERIARVLLLYPYNNTFPAGIAAGEAVRRRLSEKLPGQLDIFADSLDLARFPEEAHEERTARYLAEKYADKQPDVVIALGPEALRFILAHREAIAPKVPIVFSATSPAALTAINPPTDVTGVISEFDLAKTMELAERLQPEARHLVVITGASAFDRRWAENARRQLAPFEQRYQTTYLVGLDKNDLLDQLRRLSRDTIVLLTTVFTDGTGRLFVPADIAEDIAQAAAAPVYAPYDTYLGRGIVGGYVASFEALGSAAANLALQIFAGADPASVVPQLDPGSGYSVDARQLARWQLAAKNLPADTTVLFDRPTLWEEHGDLVTLAIAAFGLQSAVMLALLAQVRRRRHAEAKLKQSQDRMTFAAANANIGFWHLDRPTNKLWLTEHCGTMLGLPPEGELTHETIVSAIHAEDRETVVESMREAAHTGALELHEFRAVLPDGQTRWFLARSHADRDAEGKPIRLSGFFADITARKSAEAEAETKRRELAHLMRVSVLGELSGAIAHELNQPLTAILSNAQAARRLLAQEVPQLDDVREILDDIVAADTRAGEVIHRLRKLLKKDGNKVEPVDCNDLVQSTLGLLRSELVGRKITVDLKLADALPATLGDPVQLQQVLLNLMMNAMEAMATVRPPNRTIAISTHATTTGLELVVADHGRGISADDSKRVFEPFFTTKEQGLGLGLSICSTIVTSHGGELSLTGNAGGATATVRLPGHGAQFMAAAK